LQLDLGRIGNLISATLGGTHRPCVIFDSLDAVALSQGEGSAIQFLLACLRQLETSRATGVATVTTGIHTPRFETILRAYFKGVIELKLEETEGKLTRYVRIFRLPSASHHTDWQPFTITEDGIIIGTKESRSKLPPRHAELHFLRFMEDYKEPPEVVDSPKLTWDDLGGQDEVKQVLREAVELPLRQSEDYKKMKVRPPRGILLFGPPGGGKTHVAKVLASVLNANMVALKGAELLGSDDPKKRISELFEWARSNSPTIIFFDEVDSLASNRTLTNPLDKSYKVVTQLLSEMDGLGEEQHVIVIATTNHPEVIDEALLRPGRFDREVYVPPPDFTTRKRIIERLTSDIRLGNKVNLNALARRTEGYTAAAVYAVCNEAKAQLLKSRIQGDTRQNLDERDFQAALKLFRPSLSPSALTKYEEFRNRGAKPATSETQRTLSAIMFTDMVRYTSLSQKNEELALALLEQQREVVRSVVPRFNGREVKTMGDGFLLEFSSALKATRCAIEIQRAIGARNAKAKRRDKIELRIGIHVGDVVRQGNDIVGDGVNVASRIVSIAKPGGICVSQQVFDQVQNKLDQTLKRIGSLRLKHLRNPLPVYRIVFTRLSYPPASRTQIP